MAVTTCPAIGFLQAPQTPLATVWTPSLLRSDCKLPSMLSSLLAGLGAGEGEVFPGEWILLCTLKSDREAISSSSSRVAEEADILACCCDSESCPSVCSSDTTNGVGCGAGTELSNSFRRLSTLGRTSSIPRVGPLRLGFSTTGGMALPAVETPFSCTWWTTLLPGSGGAASSSVAKAGVLCCTALSSNSRRSSSDRLLPSEFIAPADESLLFCLLGRLYTWSSPPVGWPRLLLSLDQGLLCAVLTDSISSTPFRAWSEGVGGTWDGEQTSC